MGKINDISSWTDYYTKLEKADFRLFCIPFAGGGASKYAPWKRLVPEGVELVPIQLPGREKRVREHLADDCCELADRIAEAVSVISSDGLPFSVFGHSMGGILAYEVVKRLEKTEYSPEKCYISSTDPKGISGVRGINELSDEKLVEAVSDYGAAADLEILKQFPRYFDMFMGIIRADLAMLEGYKPDIGNKIKTPIRALYSTGDKMINEDKMRIWRTMTSSDFKLYPFPGDHFYLFEDSKSVVKRIFE